MQKDEGVHLSEHAVGLLRRLEKLMAEANSNITRFSTSLSGAQAPAAGAASNDLLLPAALFFGIVAIGLIVVLVAPRD